ncbi:hypothetical protein BURPS305_3668 [Burkholderia pseudomallei 305]|nr:hypothetical protein BURPS305_3668 [Burkholderia pseudomallei 305]
MRCPQERRWRAKRSGNVDKIHRIESLRSARASRLPHHHA